METIKQITLLDAKSIGKLLSLSKRQIFRLKSAGKLPSCLKIGGAVRWRKSDIDLWIELGCPDIFEFDKQKEALR